MFILLLYLILLIDSNDAVVLFCALSSLLFIGCLKIKVNLSVDKIFLLFSFVFTFLLNVPTILSSLYFFLFIPYLFEFNFKDKYKLLLSPTPLIYFIVLLQLITFFEIIDYNFLNKIIGTQVSYLQLPDYSGLPLNEKRSYGIFVNPNYAAIIMMTLYFLSLEEKNNSKILQSIFVLIGIITTGSRAGLLSFLIINFFLFFHNKKLKLQKIIILSAISILIVISYYLNLRVLKFENLTADPSYSIRIKNLIIYISAIYENKDFLKFLFGNGLRDDYVYFFDGDIGNLFYSLGIIGSLSFYIVIFIELKKLNSYYIFFSLFPILLAGGIFGNYKTLYFFIFFPAIIKLLRNLKA